MRRITSIVLAISFIALFVSIVFMTTRHHEGHRKGEPQIVSNHQDIQKALPPQHRERDFFPMGLHELAGGIVILFGIVHICYNSKAILRYIGIKPKQK